MESVSLIDIHRNGKGLGLLAPESVHFPEHGASALALVEADHFWFTERRKLILQLVKKYLPGSHRQGLMALDVGCGSGFTAVWLTDNGIPTMGIDVHPGFNYFASQKRGYGFLQGDIFSVEPRPEFDLILLLDTLEHIEADSEFLNQVSKALKPGGIVVISVPAFQWLWSPADDRAGHRRRYRRSDISKYEKLSDSRFNIAFSTYYYLLTLPLFILSRKLQVKKEHTLQDDVTPMKSNFINASLKAILTVERFFLRLFPMPLGSSVFAVLKKQESGN